MNEKNNKTGKVKNTVALKRGIYSIILSVLFIVGVVLITALATALSARYPLELDLTANKEHTMSSDNVKYIKSVNKKVNIYVCLTEDEYNCTSDTGYTLAYYAANTDFVDASGVNTSYYVQTIEMLKKYAQYNDNITVTFLDMSQPSAKEVTDRFTDYKTTYGDILVESTFAVGGENVTRRTAVLYKDVYTLKAGDTNTENYRQYAAMGVNYALYGQGIGYMITENKVEQAISAAIYKVTSETTPVFLVPSTYCNVDSIKGALEGTLKSNNFDIVYKDGMLSTLLTSDSYDAYTGIILSDCTSDITGADRTAIESFLDNGGNKGKSLLYFAGTGTYKLTNICALLGDWGIGFDSGILYETNNSMYIAKDPTSFYYRSLETDYTKTADSLSNICFTAANSVPMRQLYENSSTATYVRETTVAMRTASGTVVVMPAGESKDTWKPESDTDKDAYPTVIVSEDQATVESNFVFSGVAAFASADFISSDWSQYTSVANLNATLDITNYLTGSTDNPFNFVAKKLTNEDFRVNVTESKTLAIRIIFMAVVPIIIVAVGITVWIRRKTK